MQKRSAIPTTAYEVGLVVHGRHEEAGEGDPVRAPSPGRRCRRAREVAGAADGDGVEGAGAWRSPWPRLVESWRVERRGEGWGFNFLSASASARRKQIKGVRDADECLLGRGMEWVGAYCIIHRLSP